MAELPLYDDNKGKSDQGCGTGCGAGLEKIYPTTAVRYGAMRWVGEFSVRQGSVFTCGGKVVIQTDRGTEIGEQVSLTCNGCSKSVNREQIKRYINNCGPEFYRPRSGRILRGATPDDISDHEHLNAHNIQDIDRCQLLAAQMNLDMKVVTVEHLLGGERIVFYFRSDDRIDFRELVKLLAHEYHTRIEMRQVGARDEARLVADYEICGRECCCKNFLKKLRPVTMRMAKLQKSTLDPTKVSGRCGRLRCCLRYEHDGYEELAAKLPHTNSFVDTEFGIAQVIDKQILTQLVLVRASDGRLITVPNEEIKATNLPEPTDWARPMQRRGPDEPPPEGENQQRGPRGRRGPRRELRDEADGGGQRSREDSLPRPPRDADVGGDDESSGFVADEAELHEAESRDAGQVSMPIQRSDEPIADGEDADDGADEAVPGADGPNESPGRNDGPPRRRRRRRRRGPRPPGNEGGNAPQ